MTNNITLGLAALAGLASFLSPCVLSLVPAYVGYLGGRSATAIRAGQQNRWLTVTHGLAFVLGFSLVFISLGVAVSAIGGLLYDLKTWLARLGGVVVVIMGLRLAGIIKVPWLLYDLRYQMSPSPRGGYLSSILMGVFFSAGWSPCLGPVLGAILTFTLSGGSILTGLQLLSAYSLGLAVPFLVASLGIGWVTLIISRYGKLLHYLEVILGVMLVVMGVLLSLGVLEQLVRWGTFVDFGL